MLRAPACLIPSPTGRATPRPTPPGAVRGRPRLETRVEESHRGERLAKKSAGPGACERAGLRSPRGSAHAPDGRRLSAPTRDFGPTARLRLQVRVARCPHRRHPVHREVVRHRAGKHRTAGARCRADRPAVLFAWNTEWGPARHNARLHGARSACGRHRPAHRALSHPRHVSHDIECDSESDSSDVAVARGQARSEWRVLSACARARSTVGSVAVRNPVAR